LVGSVLVVGLVAAMAWGEEAGKADRLREDLRAMITAARDRVFPALVNIHVVTVRYYNGKEHKGSGVGSGSIISPEGYVLTNQHVTSRGQRFRCTLADKQEIGATLVGEDPLTDLAVLKMNLDELADSHAPLAVATFGDSDRLQVGDQVMSMGSPFALSRSVTLGIVSNTERVFAGGLGGNDYEAMELEEGQRTGLFTQWIQHDALINPGNSGGPLVNLEGQIVGVNELGGSAMGFAIPSNLAQQVAKALIEHGEVPRSWVGVSFKPIKKTGYDEGVLINSIVADGPAAKAGIRAGDNLLAIDGEAIRVRFPEQVPPLMKGIADRPIGSSIKWKYRRGDEAHDAAVVTEKLEKDRGDERAFRSWGLSVQEITPKMARDQRLDNAEGVLVTGVRSGGPAQLAEPAMEGGDVIRRVAEEGVASLSGFTDLYQKIMDAEDVPEYLLVEFDRDGQSHLTLIEPQPEKDEDPPREVPKAWIGVATQPVLQKLAKQLGTEKTRGFRITRVYPNTTAADTALRIGDIITGLNGKNLSPRGMQDAALFQRTVRKLDSDGEATLTVLRGKEVMEVKVALERTKIGPEEARRDLNRDFEISVRELTFFDRDEHRWDEEVRGVLVESAENAGWAGLGGIQSGDLIIEINNAAIGGLKTYRQVMETITKDQPERVVMVVLRGIRTHYQFIEPDWKPTTDEDKVAEKAEQKESN
jgi:serine protease Do